MDTVATFSAPWSRLLKVATGLALAVCVGIVGLGATVLPLSHPAIRWTVLLVPTFVVVCTAPFMVRGYSIAGDILIIHRLGWDSRISLEGLVSATPDPDAMKNSLRLWGNGGLFAFCGLFHNRKLGNYRAFATDPAKSVVLKYGDRLVVVTPNDPEKFAREITAKN